MSTPLRVLIVEDRPLDAELMICELKQAGYDPDWRRVETETDYLVEFKDTPDLILTDHNVPEFGASRVLKLLQERGSDIPCIVVTGTISEEVAVQRIKDGAADYILKDRMTCLGQAVERALNQKRLRDEKRRIDTSLCESEARKTAVLEAALDCIITMDQQGRIIDLNPAAERTFGYTRIEAIGKDTAELIIPPLREKDRNGLARDLATGVGSALGKRLEMTAIRADGDQFPVELAIRRIAVDGPPLFTAYIRDITERKQAEEKARRNLERARALRDIDLAISSILDLRAVMDVVLKKISLIFPLAAAGTIRLLDKQTGEMEPVACRNLDEREWKTATARVPGGVGRMLPPDNAPLAVRNAQTDRRSVAPDLLRKYGLRSFLRIPLRAERDLLGMLTVFTQEEHEFTDEEIEFLVALARQAGIAIHNAQRYGDSVKTNRSKDEFLKIMSHELRTPLTVVMGYIELLKEGTLGAVNEQQQQALQQVLDRAADQIDMVNQILQTSQLETRAVGVHREFLDLRDVLANLRSDYELCKGKPNVKLVWDYPAVSMPMTSDGVKLKQILQNLINNALKFTDEGTVTVSARVAERPLTGGGWVEFRVEDTGIGIPRDRLAVIFDKFYQVDGAATRCYGGVGLGLYIVKNFTDLLKGQVSVESELGKGTTFTVKIPCEVG